MDLKEISELSLGAGGRNRTDMGSPPLDFESSASTSFTTPAQRDALFTYLAFLCQGESRPT